VNPVQSSVVLANKGDLARGAGWIGLLFAACGAIMAGGPIATAAFGKDSWTPGVIVWVLLFAGAGLTLFYLGMKLLVAPRQVTFDPISRELEDIRGVFGSKRVRRPLSAFGHVCLKAERQSRNSKALFYSVELQGPSAWLLLGEQLRERNDALLLAVRTARVTGLPFDQMDHSKGVIRLSREDIARLPAPDDTADLPWWRLPSVTTLLLAHLVPLAGVLYAGWAVLPVMLLFWLENLVICGYTVARMLLAQKGTSDVPPFVRVASNMFLSAFFVLHFGAFAAVQGLVLTTLFGHDGMPTGSFDPAGLALAVRIIAQYVSQYDLQWAVLALVLSHGVSFWQYYLRPRAYEHAMAGDLMMVPYARVWVLSVVIIAGGFLAMLMNGSLITVALLVVLKTAVDLAAHLREHRRGGPRQILAIAEMSDARAPIPLLEYVAQQAALARRLAPAAAPAPAPKPDFNDKPMSH